MKFAAHQLNLPSIYHSKALCKKFTEFQGDKGPDLEELIIQMRVRRETHR